MKLEQKLIPSLERLGVGPTDALGVACSGGADSIALLHLLARIRPTPALNALHVDHALREHSAEDAAFVERVAGELGIACTIRRVAIERTPRESLEADARRARYEALRSVAGEAGLAFVATAHTLDDQSETVLLRLTRGGNLAGIAPVNGIFVRPLLDVRRAELRDWLLSNDIAWREDPTNEDTTYERNWIRHQVLPLLRGRRSGVDDVLARHASSAREDARALDALAAQAFEHAGVDDAGVFLPDTPLPTAITRRVVRLALRTLGSDPSSATLDRIAGLDIGSHVASEHVCVWRFVDGLALVRDPIGVPSEAELPAVGTVVLEDWGVRVRVGSAQATPWRWRTTVPSTELRLRSRRPGDRVRTKGGTKKIQDVLVDAKVERPLRDLVPVVSSAREALAVVGFTVAPGGEALALDVEPIGSGWSRTRLWATG